MLTVLGQPRRCCDGQTRRELLQAGALSLFGSLLTPTLLPAETARPRRPAARARSVVLLDLFGGPSHLDTFDLKPDSPPEIRGPFQADRHLPAGPPDLRAPAAAGPLDAPDLPDPHHLPRLQQPQPLRRHDRLHRRQRPSRTTSPSRATTPAWGRSASTSASAGGATCPATWSCPPCPATARACGGPVRMAATSAGQYDPVFAVCAGARRQRHRR